MQSFKDKAPRHGGPDLLAGGGKHQRPASEGNRILANLEHGPGLIPGTAAIRYRPGRTALLSAGVLLMLGVVSWLSYQQAVAPTPLVLASTPLRDARPSPAPVPAPTAEPEVQAAAIINETPPARAATPAKAAPAPVKVAPSAAPAARPSPPLPARRGGAAPDSDVALLSAMVAHANGQPPPEGSKRDVVLRKGDESTESLLQRCKELGLIEGMLCRSRICAGRWDSDLACR
ncbi:hypothetical protein [Janthinobacterium agaricidamnosum]|uniref:Uncharacterized protein n=1 Tax=Janthinobacterium agaricidamnosum NBRC 102515 = DSM 9628 TaxID=1349767 RepID=W0V5D5_9BURK|nr:hypothetical protein [Janthinobacterium agaricidamnosum]CDG84034.1 hypothetical protein GJA_3415 [Janthinobacterium agaricidamnosum NBRC 102515 = DSM 9628]